MRRTKANGAGCVIAMLGEHGSLAYDGQSFYHQAAENVPVVNTVGAGDSYIAAFTYGVSLGRASAVHGTGQGPRDPDRAAV